MQYTLDRYRSICSAIICPLEITADGYFVTSKWCGLRCNPSCLYISTDNGLLTRFMPTKYHHFACFVRYLNVCFVHVSVCASVQLEMHRPGKRIRSQMYRHSHVLHFILFLTFTASLYDGKYACFYMGVVRSITRLIHGIARQMGAFN